MGRSPVWPVSGSLERKVRTNYACSIQYVREIKRFILYMCVMLDQQYEPVCAVTQLPCRGNDVWGSPFELLFFPEASV